MEKKFTVKATSKNPFPQNFPSPGPSLFLRRLARVIQASPPKYSVAALLKSYHEVTPSGAKSCNLQSNVSLSMSTIFFCDHMTFLLHSLKPEKISDYHWAPSSWQHACPDQLRSWKPAANPMATESPTHQTQHKKECHGPMGQQLQIVSQRWRPWNQSFYTVFEANGQITCPWFPIRMSLEDCHPVRHSSWDFNKLEL